MPGIVFVSLHHQVKHARAHTEQEKGLGDIPAPVYEHVVPLFDFSLCLAGRYRVYQCHHSSWIRVAVFVDQKAKDLRKNK